jgi:LytS/YehU family sensor histidine kinase
MKTVQQFIRGKTWKIHLIFCMSVLLLFLAMYLLNISGFRFRDTASAFSDSFLFLLCIYTGRWVCGKWYLKQRIVPFTIYLICTVLAMIVVKFLLIKYAFGHIHVNIIELTRDVSLFFLIGLAAGVVSIIIQSAMQRELLSAQTLAAQKESEFNLLQSQLSPHFLFNVLNNLYGIALEEDKRIPGLLLKLSQLLRYSVYGAKRSFIPLKEELEYIQSYIDFEQIRISDRLVLVTDIDPGSDPQTKIASLVLIVFLENAFKHSANTLTAKTHIFISLRIIDNFIEFCVVNSYSEENSMAEFSAESSGLGIANTIKRLQLLYGENHTLKQYTKEGLYHVELKLKVNND